MNFTFAVYQCIQRPALTLKWTLYFSSGISMHTYIYVISFFSKARGLEIP